MSADIPDGPDGDGNDAADERGGGGGGPTPAAVRERLDRVTDPELDRSVVELDYLDEVRVDGGTVHVRFTLPTAWCSPAFAWMMATDMHEEAGALPGVGEVTVELHDHMHAEEVNRGVAEGLAFTEVFEEAEDDVTAVREKLDRKARLARQYRAVEALLDAGLGPEHIVALTPADVDFENDRATVSMDEGAFVVSAPAEPLRRYLRKAREVDVVERDDDPLFATPEREPISTDEFELVHNRTRLAKTNMDGQGGVCAGLHDARDPDRKSENWADD